MITGKDKRHIIFIWAVIITLEILLLSCNVSRNPHNDYKAIAIKAQQITNEKR